MIDRGWRSAVCDEGHGKRTRREIRAATAAAVALVMLGFDASLPIVVLAMLGLDDKRKFAGGTQYEPGHRQRVRVLLDGKRRGWATAVYDRISCSFWLHFKSLRGWVEVAVPVVAWTQFPPGPGFVDPEVA